LSRSSRAAAPDLLDGCVVASYGRRYSVEVAGGTVLDCVTRGRRGEIACGDRVQVAVTSPGAGVIEAVSPRASLFYRSDRNREKLVAANVTQAFVVVAPVPTWSPELVDRCLAAAEHEGIRALIVLNKCDLPDSAAALAALDCYRGLGYTVLTIAAKRDVSPLRPHLAGRVSVLVGQSGMGKSTIINALLPEAAARVGEVSVALDGGRHTTTHARLYRLDADTAIIDSPGMQEFGVHHLTVVDLTHGFVELRPYHGQCRFNDCLHLTEPGCAVTAAAERGLINARRLASYRRLASEIAQPRRY
jgi:ribosome biogenesis GTPase